MGHCKETVPAISPLWLIWWSENEYTNCGRAIRTWTSGQVNNLLAQFFCFSQICLFGCFFASPFFVLILFGVFLFLQTGSAIDGSVDHRLRLPKANRLGHWWVCGPPFAIAERKPAGPLMGLWTTVRDCRTVQRKSLSDFKPSLLDPSIFPSGKYVVDMYRITCKSELK